MNRAQRRKSQKDKKDNISPRKVVAGTAFGSAIARRPAAISSAVPEQPDFSGVPLATVCQSIQLLINELYQRGYPVYDFDNKDKFIQGIQIIKGKVFFLAAKGEIEHEKV